jgi:hypothetical protein
MTDDEKPIGEQLKQTLEELDLENRVKAAAAAAEDALYRGLGAAGQYVHERRGGIEAFLDRAATGIDEQTGGRFTGPVGELRDSIAAGVASLADRRPMTVPDDVSELELPEAPADEAGGGPTGPTDATDATDPWSGTTDDPSRPHDDPQTPDESGTGSSRSRRPGPPNGPGLWPHGIERVDSSGPLWVRR